MNLEIVMNNLLRHAGCAVLITIMAGGAIAQSAYFSYVEEPVHPRSTAMGGSGTAGSSGGFSYYNPAGPATLDRPFVAFEYGQQWSDMTRGYIETAVLFPEWFIGGSFMTQGISFTPVDEFGTPLPGEGTQQESQLTLLTGWKNDRFAIGVAINGLQHHIYDADAYALSASGGITATLLPSKLAIGAALLQAGRLHRGFDENKFTVHKDGMPTSARLGVTLNDTLFSKLPTTLQVDAVYSLNYSRVMVPVGIELRPLAPLAIRLGKRFNHPTDLFTCGIGLSWENLSYDVALIPTGLEGDAGLKWRMGLTYSLARKKKQVEKADTATVLLPQTTPVEAPEEPVPADTVPSAPAPEENTESTADTAAPADTTSSIDTPTAPAVADSAAPQLPADVSETVPADTAAVSEPSETATPAVKSSGEDTLHPAPTPDQDQAPAEAVTGEQEKDTAVPADSTTVKR